jgi:DNA-binding Xre family transcriptional regulator
MYIDNIASGLDCISTKIIYVRIISSQERRDAMPSIERLNVAEVGKRLRQRRTGQQLSQQALAQMMKIPQGWISELEHGKRPHLEADTIYRICQALDCTTDYLVGLSDDPTPPPKRTRPRTAASVG